MKTANLVLVLILAIGSALIVFGVLHWSYLQYNSVPYKPVPLIAATVSPEDVTVVQGATFQVRIKITSRSDSELTIPIEGITLRFTNYTIYDQVPQEEIFSYRFIFNSLTLGPGATKSTVLTVDLKEEAPIGDFEITVDFGNADTTHVSGAMFRLTIADHVLADPMVRLVTVDSGWSEYYHENHLEISESAASVGIVTVSSERFSDLIEEKLAASNDYVYVYSFHDFMMYIEKNEYPINGHIKSVTVYLSPR